MNPNLKPVPQEDDKPRKETWATDRPYKKPALKPPHFPPALITTPSPDAVKKRIAETREKAVEDKRVKQGKKKVKKSRWAAWLERVRGK